MKPLKNSNCNKNSKSISLEGFISFCIDESVKISMNGGGDLWEVDKRISEVYDFENEAAIKMYSPIFDYLTCDIKTRIIDCDCTSKYTKWHATEKAINLSKEDKFTIIKNIAKKNKEYYEAIKQKFNLDILIQ